MKKKITHIGLLLFLAVFFSVSFLSRSVEVVEVTETIIVSENPMNFDKFINDLGMIESRNNYEARRPNSQYWGKYQLGTSARKAIGIDTISWERFKNDSILQDAAVMVYLLKMKERLTDHMYPDSTVRDFIEEFCGSAMANYNITESGLIAMSHNCGVTDTKRFLIKDGKYVPIDGLGTPATKYLTLANYDLDLTLEEAEQRLRYLLWADQFLFALNNFNANLNPNG